MTKVELDAMIARSRADDTEAIEAFVGGRGPIAAVPEHLRWAAVETRLGALEERVRKLEEDGAWFAREEELHQQGLRYQPAHFASEI